MKEKLTGCLLLVLLIVLIPAMITLVFGRDVLLPVSGDGGTQSPQVSVGEGNQTIDLKEYLIGVTAAQIPGDYSLEAVKAQMILNRTYYYCVLGDRTNLSAEELDFSYLSEEERAAKWAATGDTEAVKRFEQAAVETEGQVMTCQRKLAVGMYHSVSAGVTRGLSEKYPYLCSVDSEWDSRAEGYLTVIEYGEDVLLQKLKEKLDPNIASAIGRDVLQILERDAAGYVESLMVGTTIVAGDEFADCLDLPSAAFSFQWPDEGRLSIVCLGQGHGYGLSQYGADCLAREGKSALQILQYYFQNVTLETWKRDE